MSLTEKDRLDLVALDAGLGTLESDKYARHLIQHDRDAAEYYRELRQLPELLEQSMRPSSEEQLSHADADKIAAAVLARLDTRKEGTAGASPRRRTWNTWPFRVVAAVLLLGVCTTWVALSMKLGSAREPSPTVTLLLYPSFREGGASGRTQEKLSPGDRVQTAENYASLVFEDGTVAVAQPKADLTIGRDARLLVVNEGRVFVAAPESITAHLGEAVTVLSAARAKLRAIDGLLSWMIYEGTANITVDGEGFEITSGQQAHWDRKKREMNIRELEEGIPDWATSGLNVRPKP